MSEPNKPQKINLRRPEIMARVEAEVSEHYQSSLVEALRSRGSEITIGNTTVNLAEQFGFCYGVKRAIDLAYATRTTFPNERIFLIGEIIHNPEVNRQLGEMKISSLPWQKINEEYDDLGPEDVVIIPAFGAPTEFMEKIENRGARIVDTTCGDVMKVWRRVQFYAQNGITSIIHGKSGHEETRATASRALGKSKTNSLLGHYIIILTLDDCNSLCDFICGKLSKSELLARLPKTAISPGFDPEKHLVKVGVANQTTMLKSETEEIQRRIRQAILERDGMEENYQVFDTICGATQERQDALFSMLKKPLDLLIVVGGYNSSNTTHLVEIAETKLPTFFIRNALCIKDLEEIVHFDLHQEKEITSSYASLIASKNPISVGITAGASCPDNLIEDVIVRIFLLRGTQLEEIQRYLK